MDGNEKTSNSPETMNENKSGISFSWFQEEELDFKEKGEIDSLTFIYLEAGHSPTSEEAKQKRFALDVIQLGNGIALAVILLVLFICCITGSGGRKSHPGIISFVFFFFLGDLVLALNLQIPGLTSQTCIVLGISHYWTHLMCSVWLVSMSLPSPFHNQRQFLLVAPMVMTICLCWTLVSYYLSRWNPAPTLHDQFPCGLSFYQSMLLGFVGPVCCLILVNTMVVIRQMRAMMKLNEILDEDEYRSRCRALTGAATLLPFYAVDWFLEALALHQRDLTLSLTSITVHLLLVFLVLRYHGPNLPKWSCCSRTTSGSHYEEDTQPLITEAHGTIPADKSVQQIEVACIGSEELYCGPSSELVISFKHNYLPLSDPNSSYGEFGT